MYKYDSMQRGDWIKSKSCLDFKKRKKEKKIPHWPDVNELLINSEHTRRSQSESRDTGWQREIEKIESFKVNGNVQRKLVVSLRQVEKTWGNDRVSASVCACVCSNYISSQGWWMIELLSAALGPEHTVLLLISHHHNVCVYVCATAEYWLQFKEIAIWN